MSCIHFSIEKRYQIEILQKEKYSTRNIAPFKECTILPSLAKSNIFLKSILRMGDNKMLAKKWLAKAVLPAS
ncbi:hypothetical protein EGX98_11905 [Fusobacterium necrophorum]|uniref:Uncharacterized protein n=1 Tax=Fusobacterium necrophorum DJ-2 TaxID=1441737 RepID=A0AB73C376_9FUSO|nr:hypothetical protein [Fusobacterium necrophorum]KDE72153.1 hypothetical protein FUSO8_06085 [Fusobacterium necrophorum DJ-2]AYZ74660.1 hypothetical protein EGX98_11905 [Fusobacterium necrophorum]AZW09454.1 hypothetical protein EO219_07680 [Fusobacterium necrophorum subsp. necrophorum]KDE64427.1 hypothetical protein FUSO4_07940 [Fusobacterium necrophorum DJ-1]MBR8823433.1 hypothetical protein [Fusobacterium necrophorum]